MQTGPVFSSQCGGGGGGAMQENTVAQAAIRNGLYRDKEAMWENMSHRLMWGMQDTEKHELR